MSAQTFIKRRSKPCDRGPGIFAWLGARAAHAAGAACTRSVRQRARTNWRLAPFTFCFELTANNERGEIMSAVGWTKCLALLSLFAVEVALLQGRHRGGRRRLCADPLR